ncbi:MAG: extracellular solute-binding protein [Dehalococcoidia bacterium]|nr:extracellular solute-binding protein [Dehalococcoidia bacterium]
MKRVFFYGASIVFIFTIVLSGCTPKAVPAPGTTSPGTVSSTPAPSKPGVSAESTAWNTVVEAAKKERKVTVYSYSWVGDSGVAISNAFKAKYGIELDLITGRGSEFIERLKTEKRMGRMTADIFEGSPSHLPNAKDANTLTASASNLPSLQETGVWAVEPLFLDKDGFILPFMSMVASPYINTKIIKPGEEPKSWLDIQQPRWKGQIMVQDPAISTGAYRLLAYVKYGVFTEDFLRQLNNQDIRFTTGLQQEAQLLAQGERALSLYLIDSDTASAIKDGAPIKAVSMKEGVLAQVMAIGQIKDNPHPNAAKVFLNWLFTQEGQKINAEAKGSGSIRKDVPSFSPPGAQVQTKLLVLTAEMLNDYAKLFQEKSLVKLWNR